MSNPISGHSKLAADISNALGIKHCRMLEIRFHVGEIVTVKAEFFPEEDGVMKFPAIFKEYELVEKKVKECECTHSHTKEVRSEYPPNWPIGARYICLNCGKYLKY